MNELDELQAFIAAAVRERRALPKNTEIARRAAACIGGNELVSPVEQLEIYREQFWLRHTSSLLEDFPGLAGIIGQDAWQRLSEEYLLSEPPESYTLRDLGLKLPEFVADSSWLEHRELCTDMARLERCYLEVFDAADPTPLDASRLAAIPDDAWEGARLVLQPALRLLKTNYPVAPLRRRLREAEDSGERVPIPEPEPGRLAVYRRARELFYEELAEPAFELLVRLAAGARLSDACEGTREAVPAHAGIIEARIGEWFRDWAERGFIVDVSI